MKTKLLLSALVVLLFSNLNAQNKKEGEVCVLKYVDSVVGKHVTFVSWYSEKDTIKVTQFRIWDYNEKKYFDFFLEDIKVLYPILFRGFTIKINTPFSCSYGGNVIDFDLVNPIYFLNRANFINTITYFGS